MRTRLSVAPAGRDERTHWPGTEIIIRGDSGFCREAIMAWNEGHGVDFVLGIAKDARLLALSLSARIQAQLEHHDIVL